jgi:hypothetical protein
MTSIVAVNKPANKNQMNTETITTTSNATSTLPPVTEAPPETAYTNLSHLAAT